MKINIICVGSIKDKFYSEACGEYIKRLGRFCDINLVETPECNYISEPQKAQTEEILCGEAEKYLKLLKGFVIVTDIYGQSMDSRKFSDFLSQKKTEGISEFSFLIGGSYGISKDIKKSAGLRLSFSEMTFPHRLFRVMLLEQIYRAFMIENNMTYHK